MAMFPYGCIVYAPIIAGKKGIKNPNKMDKEKIITLVAKGRLAEAIDLLLEISSQFVLNFNDKIILVSSRFNAIKSDKQKGIIRNDEYILESNLVANDILEIISKLDELDTSKIKLKSNSMISEKIDILNEDFLKCSSIKTKTSRLRMKNNIAKSIGENFIQSPEIIKEYIPTDSNGIICGLGKKVQAVPEFGDLDLIELIMDKMTSSFTKGCITNAVAELIYSQKLQIGDDERIRKMLKNLKKNADVPLVKNIERVEAALSYLLDGK